jgi:hypothetical protein
MPNQIADQQTNQQTNEEGKNDEPPASLHPMIMVTIRGWSHDNW